VKNLFLFAIFLLMPGLAFAQDEETIDDDFLDEILNEPTESSNKEERDTLIEETETPETPPPPAPRRRVIKTLQKKTFMKLSRWEGTGSLGFVTNDPFINRYFVSLALAYHVTEIFGIELAGAYSPDFGRGDWKSVTKQIVDENQVTPDISKIQFYGSACFQFSPIYGKVAIMGRNIIMFDVFGVFGTGMVNTKDDLDALQKPDAEIAKNTEVQFHPTLNFGGGIRISFNPTFSLRFEGRGMSYVEVLESTTLEMKNNVMLQASASFFFPGMK
jgi:outer membrane beta-barrel protein